MTLNAAKIKENYFATGLCYAAPNSLCNLPKKNSPIINLSAEDHSNRAWQSQSFISSLINAPWRNFGNLWHSCDTKIQIQCKFCSHSNKLLNYRNGRKSHQTNKNYSNQKIVCTQTMTLEESEKNGKQLKLVLLRLMAKSR